MARVLFDGTSLGIATHNSNPFEISHDYRLAIQAIWDGTIVASSVTLQVTNDRRALKDPDSVTWSAHAASLTAPAASANDEMVEASTAARYARLQIVVTTGGAYTARVHSKR